MNHATCVSCGADVDAGARRCVVCSGKRNRWIIAGVGALVIGGAVALIVTQVDLGKAPGKTADDKGSAARLGSNAGGPLDPSLDEDRTPSLTEKAAIEKCDDERILNITQAYIENDKFEGAVRAAKTYQGKCEHNHRLDWKWLYAHEQLKQWKEAEAVATRLVNHEPNDGDFWWWRGKARSYIGQHEKAIVDIRQSLADSDEDSNGVQVGHLERATTGAKQGCEHAFALRWLSNVGVELSSSAEREFHQVYLANECEKLDGRGSFEWKSENLARAKFKGTLGGKKIQFHLDRNLGTVLVPSALADELKLVRGAEVDVMTPTGPGKGVTSTADVVVGGAKASGVPVVIVEKLPEGHEAVLALSFLWRFKVEPTDDGFKAQTPEH